MYVDDVPNRSSRPTILLRECWREDGKVRKRTLANMTNWPEHVIDAIRRAVKGEHLLSIDDLFSIEESLPHGHVEAILGLIRRLGFDSLIASKRSRQRDLVIAMIVERLISPCSKLATTRLWSSTSLGRELGVPDADANELYETMTWLLKRQKRIEKKLARRRLSEESLVLYDVSSSYYEGRPCATALDSPAW